MGNMWLYKHQEILALPFLITNIFIQLYLWLCAMPIINFFMLTLEKLADVVIPQCLKIQNLDQPF